ncbi:MULTISPECIES: SMP-30/gluconolactonase/LRE family protein [unclassified Okeania]|nr:MULTISPECIES: SMP-30/gluconolactonase/LRE family protein [unclassified Okeania]NES76143.1 ATP-grasp domain-containing protein [Okeania sp. SIO1H4]NET19586.1 ATP-grasp domain-containing protein [Okeania sp. SIO1H5]NET93323.1 ATP-grasp domain-containing protein [Okeania sp. SIO1H2]
MVKNIYSQFTLKVATVTVINPSDKLIPILVLCPSQNEKQLFYRAEFSDYCFHCLEYSCLQTTPPKIKDRVDLVAFCQDAIAYAQAHQIVAIYYSFDIANLVAAIVCEKLNLFGPRFESVVQCFHKFYARKIDSYAPGYSVVQWENEGKLTIDEQILTKLKFPLFVKPVCSSYGMFCGKINKPEQLPELCNNLAKNYQPWWQMYQVLFQEFIDSRKYPLATTSQVPLLVEEMVSGQPLTCDGFVYQGQVHFVGLVDTLEAEDGSVDCYIFPAQVSCKQQQNIYARVTNFIQDSGLDNSFFSAEFWLQGQDTPILIEINARMSATFGFLYQQSLNFNLPKAALKLAQGICPQAPQHRSEEEIITTCRLYISTRKSGLASTLFDFNLAQQTLDCSQLITFNCEPGEQIQDTHYHPTPLAELNLVGANRAALQFYGEHLRNALLLERRSPTYQVSVVQDCPLQGGEGLCYDGETNQLFCLDYGNPQLIKLCLTTCQVQRFPLPGLCYGVAVLTKGTLVLSGELGLVQFNLHTQKITPIIETYQGKKLVSNDVIIDTTGNIWFNTINEDTTGIKDKGKLLKCNPQGQIQEMFAGLSYANGMGLSPDGRSLYVVDSLERSIHVFVVNGDCSEFYHDRQFIVSQEHEGVPDGLAVDRAGYLWVTFWFGGKVVCIDPRSQARVREIILPVMNISSVTIVDSKCNCPADSPWKFFACSSIVPWLGGKLLAPWYVDDLVVEQRGYLFELRESEKIGGDNNIW